MKIGSFLWCHVSEGEPLIIFTYSLNLARVWFNDRVDSGPRDLDRSARIQRSSRCHVSCKTKIVWEHSPTQIKRRERLRINRGKDSPINYPNIFLCSATRGAPRGRPRGAWPPCHLARPVRLLRGPHASCHVASAPRRNDAVDLRATSARFATSAPPGPARHVSSPVSLPPFSIFLIEKLDFKIK